MVISQKALSDEIKKKFPTIRKPKDYAEVVLIGFNLKAFDRISSKTRYDFKKTGKIKEHTMNRCYNDLDLLVPIRNPNKQTVISSERLGLIFSSKKQYDIVDYEQKLLFKHIKIDHHVKLVVTKSLRLKLPSKIKDIERKMKQGNVFKQTSVYDKALSELGKHGVKRKEYLGLRVVTTNPDHYYLSTKSKDIIRKCKGGVK